MKRVWFVALAGLGLAFSSLKGSGPAPSDAFLDQSISFPPENESFVYLEQLESIAPVVGKKVIFPPGLLDYLSREKLRMAWRLGSSPNKDGRITVREYLDQRRGVVGLNWKYDAVQDAVIFDFDWHHEPASSVAIRPLVELVGNTSAVPWRQRATYPKSIPDPWETSFNALLSQPENFSHAWKTRLQDACSGAYMGFFNFWPEGVCARLLKDGSGNEHLLVLHRRESIMSGGPPPSMTYYLLDGNGKWEDGGVFGCGEYAAMSDIHFDPPNNRITILNVVKSQNLSSWELGLAGGIPTFHHYGDPGWGTPSFQYEPTRTELRLIFTAHTQETFSYQLSIEHGKLVSVLWKNGKIVAPANYDAGITPLQHFGD